MTVLENIKAAAKQDDDISIINCLAQFGISIADTLFQMPPEATADIASLRDGDEWDKFLVSLVTPCALSFANKDIPDDEEGEDDAED